MRFQRITQTISLGLFLGLLYLAAHPFQEGSPVEFFLQLDPLIGVGTALASRDVHLLLWPATVVLAAALLFGRFFCGHICPMGTTLDIFQGCFRSRKKTTAKTNASKAASAYRGWKYAVLITILTAACAGASLVHLGSPLSLITRLYGLVFHPLLLLTADLGLEWSSPFLSRIISPDLAYAQINHRFFATNAFVLIFFLTIAALAYVAPRFWCRNLCPTGALFALASWKPRIRRVVKDSCTHCGRCTRECPTTAIQEDPAKTVHSECIVCLKCVEVCPVSAISFASRVKPTHAPAQEPAEIVHDGGGNESESPEEAPAPPPTLQSQPPLKHLENLNPDFTRRRILLAAGSGIALSGLFQTSLYQPNPQGREKPYAHGELIRPPGALPEPDFLTKCIRCGECMKACPTNTLQPIWLMAGLEGLFSPIMMPRIAACAVGCHACGQVCPTGAIRNIPLIEKNHAKVGTAWINRENCLAWAHDRKCLVCDEMCPFKAISLKPVPEKNNSVPFVQPNRCMGCGWCESKCPVDGTSAIRINIIGEMRLASGSYIEKAKQFGLVFEMKKTSDHGSIPGSPGKGGTAAPTPGTGGSAPSGELPPGFTAD